nr:hypothetical protein [Tanacetum cinerariifolium]
MPLLEVFEVLEVMEVQRVLASLVDQEDNHLEDVDGRCLDLTFWDTWASMWDPYSNKRDAIEHLVMILQPGKVKYWDGLKNVMAMKLIRMVGGIRDSEPDFHCIVYARIHIIHKKHGWAYTACKNCNKKWISSPGKINHQFMYVKNMELYNLHLDVELINHFKNNFKYTETDDEESSDDFAQSKTKENNATIKDSTDEHDSDMHTASKTRDSTTSVEGSSSKKRKLIIDLDEVESEPEDNISKTYEMVAVKIEPED